MNYKSLHDRIIGLLASLFVFSSQGCQSCCVVDYHTSLFFYGSSNSCFSFTMVIGVSSMPVQCKQMAKRRTV